MRAAHKNGGLGGGNGAALLPRLCFVVERMRITGKSRTWHRVGDPYGNHNFACDAARHIRSRDALTVRVRPVIL